MAGRSRDQSGTAGKGWTMRTQLLLPAAVILALAAQTDAAPQYVVAISVDGMGSYYAQPLLNDLPAIKRMFTEGAGTFNARTDAGVAVTLPNHTGMVTGRPMSNYANPAISGHGWTSNSDPAVGQTLHTNKGSYVASVFDVIHDNGGSTAMWSGKSKFSLFDTSYNATNGAADVTGANDGRDKLDYVYVSNGVSASTLTANFLNQMASNPHTFSFVHYQDPDAAGHSYSWGSTQYTNALKAVDTQIGNILAAIESSPTLNGHTIVMLTADHGGHGNTHGNIGMLQDTQIPFVVWGAEVTAGDLYAMNATSLLDPGTAMPDYAGQQPIRNGNVANLSLDLLGLAPVPDSTIGFTQMVKVPEPLGLGAVGVLSIVALWLRLRAA